MERCQKCILPRNYSAVSFDESGCCSLCRGHRAEDRAREAAEIAGRAGQLDEMVAQLKADRNSPYDCIVPLSGGQDSSYVAQVMVRRYGLRVLAVNYDNGYRSSHALQNLAAITESLGIDLITLHPPRWLMDRLFAHFFKQVGYFCMVCDAVGYLTIGSFVHREALRLGKKPLVVGGWSKKYEFQPGLSVLSMKHFGASLQENPELRAALRGDALVEPAVFDAYTATGDIRQLSSLSADLRDRNDVGMRFIQLPEYVAWDYAEIQRTLGELGWRKPSGRHEAHFDCQLHPLQEYLKNRKHGFSQQTIKNSVLIREGRMTREEALRQIELEQTSEPSILDDVLARWKLTKNDINWEADWS